MKVAVIVPVGPGHERLSDVAADSVRAAWGHDRGPFTQLSVERVDDPDGRLGRSAARNRGMEQAPAPWHFLLDADDRMTREAFTLVDLEAPATFGAVCLDGRLSVNDRWPLTRQGLFRWGACGTLSMGLFVRGGLGLRFDERLDVGEDFDYYLRLPGFTKRRRPLVDIGYGQPSASGPRSSAGAQWREACARVIERHRRAGDRFVGAGLRRTEVGNFQHPEDPGEDGYDGRPPRRSVTGEEAEILAGLAVGRRVLEIGTGLGVSTRALASTALAVTTVDPDPWVRDPELANTTFLRSVPESGRFDLAFVDGLHQEEAVSRDIERCLALGCRFLVLHDTYLPDVRDAAARAGLNEQGAWDTPCRLAVYTPS